MSPLSPRHRTRPTGGATIRTHQPHPDRAGVTVCGRPAGRLQLTGPTDQPTCQTCAVHAPAPQHGPLEQALTASLAAAPAAGHLHATVELARHLARHLDTAGAPSAQLVGRYTRVLELLGFTTGDVQPGPPRVDGEPSPLERLRAAHQQRGISPVERARM